MTTWAYWLLSVVLVIDGLAFAGVTQVLRSTDGGKGAVALTATLALANGFCAGMCVAAAVLR